jgi:hypothetical protein
MKNLTLVSILRSSRCILFCCALLVPRQALAQNNAAGPTTEKQIAISFHNATEWHDLEATGLKTRDLESTTPNAKAAPRSIQLVTTGGDPFLWLEVPHVPDLDSGWILAFDYSCAAGLKNLQWRDGRPATANAFIDLPNLPAAEGWTVYRAEIGNLQPGPHAFRLDLGMVEGVTIELRNVKIRPPNSRELENQRQVNKRRSSKIEQAAAIQSYLTKQWSAGIDQVTLADEHLTICGHHDSQSTPQPMRLILRDLNAIAANPPTETELQVSWPLEWKWDLESETHAFRVTIPLNDLDRMHLRQRRWQLVTKPDAGPAEISSTCHFLDNVDSTAQNLPEPKRLQAAKGLTCITSHYKTEQLNELGIEHLSVNVLLNNLLLPREQSGYEPVESSGRQWWFHKNRIDELDRSLQVAKEAGIQAAAILLLANGPPESNDLIHPEADPAGTYSMPNLNHAEAAAEYAATLQFLADRYSRQDTRYGRIDHWIVHNEVDYGWQWTNMGEQPLDIFMDHYVRSMRMADLALRSANPHGRVFISLTHRWNTVDDQPWRTYAPRKMIEWLVQSSLREGDFPWGVAYHPYPQSLWEADFWNDDLPTDSFDTPLITMKNLAVLDAYMHQPKLLTREGNVRPVVCSEQGFHAAEDNAQQLEMQCKALLATWQQLRKCPSVIAFDYHRPTDHPNEGGLRLGLRGLRSPSEPQGKPKPAWEVFKAIDTPRETEFRKRHGIHED